MLRDLSRLNFGLAVQHWKRQQRTQQQIKRAKNAFLVYKKEHSERKIQFGSGANNLNGWLNTDANVKISAIFIDIKEALPFEDQSFSFAFSEHVFGYLNFNEAEQHLREVNRILITGGVYQIQTPNLDLIFKDAIETESYYKWYLGKFKVPNNAPEAVYFLNHFMKIAYGTYFHNPISLKYLAEKTSWSSIKIFENSEISSHKSLQNIAYHSKVIGDSHNRLETLVVEFTK